MPKLVLNDFSGGLNAKYRQNRIADNESSALRNARFSRFGTLSKRLGTARNVVNVSNMGAIKSVFSYRFQNMSNEQILISDGDQYARATSIGSYTSVVTGMTDTFAPEFLTFDGVVYITNGRDTVRTLTGGNVAGTVAAYPVCKYHVPHKNYVFTLNQDVAVEGSRLQWSDRGLPETYTSTNFEDIYPDDGSAGTGLVSFGDELIVFKGPPSTSNSITGDNSYINGKMFRVLGDTFDASNPTYSIEPIALPPNVGLLGHRTAKVFNGALIFAANDGFYAYLGGGRQPEPISEILREEIDDWEISDIHATTRKPAAVVYKNKYICSLYNDATSADLFSNRIYVYDQGKWYLDLIGDGTDSFATDSSTGVDWTIFNNTLYSASGFSNVLREWDTAAAFSDTQDAGTAENVNFSYLTKEFDFQEEQIFKYCYIHLRRQSSGTLTFEYNIDQRGAVSSSIDMTAPDTGDTANSSSNILRKQISIGRPGRTIQFRFYDRGANDVEIYSLELYFDKSNRHNV